MPKRNLAWILVLATIALLMWQLPQMLAVRDSVYEAFGPLVAARAEIRSRYVKEVDDQELVDAAVTAGIRAMVKQLDDPHAMYMNARQYDRFKKQTGGVFGGIGVDVWPTDTGLEVLSRQPDSPAARAGLLPGEIITHVDGRPTQGIPRAEAINNLLNGPPRTEVTLDVTTPGVAPESSSRQVRLRREEVPLDPIRGWSRSNAGGWWFMLDSDFGIGYIRLTKFTPNAQQRLDDVMQGLRRLALHGLVLDLRENTGGLVDSGIAVADRFLLSGLVVRQSGDRSGHRHWNASREGTYPHFEMAVLINASTASAAELVAGALRDHGRAVIVGERSYGKGSVQEVVELGHGDGAIKLTIAYFYLPGGQCIHRTPEAIEAEHWGVEPTLAVPLADAQRERWQAAWREAGREVEPRADPSEPLEDLQKVAAARTLLDADIQLREAVEHLRMRIRPPSARRSASSAPGSAAPGD